MRKLFSNLTLVVSFLHYSPTPLLQSPMESPPGGTFELVGLLRGERAQLSPEVCHLFSVTMQDFVHMLNEADRAWRWCMTGRIWGSGVPVCDEDLPTEMFVHAEIVDRKSSRKALVEFWGDNMFDLGSYHLTFARDTDSVEPPAKPRNREAR
ncbi:MAG: hypothetical protein TR69_WS6001000005 [candidate division WS6 bacterium OLB20]|uniref:Uncharacterized protein n=1 Tax=candidate division WS6 bacterium OLB20 TaxID=1617426 RepID=A0A136M0Y9_9BACT|nr:MAG: hypothetical protein TR69_WS6001000005 [candidate division WS6 bacterium OLB20]